jgi:hypothetical protein
MRPRALSADSLVVCTGQDGQHTLRMKHLGELLDFEEVPAVNGRDARQRGRVVGWKRVIVRVTHKSGVIRVFVLVPGPTEQELRRDSLFVRGCFCVEHRSNSAKRAAELWDNARPE